MSWSLQAGGHGNMGSATVYAPYKEAYYLSSLPLDELAEKIVAYLKQANQEAEEKEAAQREAAQKEKDMDNG